jgi:hypothetical protein
VARRSKKKGKGAVRSAQIRAQGTDYEMFEVGEINGEFAFLRGPLVLEAGEPMTLKLTFRDGTELEVEAEVEAAELGDSPGVKVVFARAIDRQSIQQKLA